MREEEGRGGEGREEGGGGGDGRGGEGSALIDCFQIVYEWF